MKRWTHRQVGGFYLTGCTTIISYYYDNYIITNLIGTTWCSTCLHKVTSNCLCQPSMMLVWLYYFCTKLWLTRLTRRSHRVRRRRSAGVQPPECTTAYSLQPTATPAGCGWAKGWVLSYILLGIIALLIFIQVIKYKSYIVIASSSIWYCSACGCLDDSMRPQAPRNKRRARERLFRT